MPFKRSKCKGFFMKCGEKAKQREKIFLLRPSALQYAPSNIHSLPQHSATALLSSIWCCPRQLLPLASAWLDTFCCHFWFVRSDFYQFHIHMTLFLRLDNYAKLWRKPRFGTFAFILFTLMVLFFLPLYNGLQKSHSPCPVQYLICFDFSSYLFIFTKGGGKTASMLSSSLSHFTLKKVESFSARAGYSTPSCSRQCISALSNRGVRDLE